MYIKEKLVTEEMIAERLNELNTMERELVDALAKDLDEYGKSHQFCLISAKEFCNIFALDPIDFGLEYYDILQDLNKPVAVNEDFKFNIFKRYTYSQKYRVFVFIFNVDVQDYLCKKKYR